MIRTRINADGGGPDDEIEDESDPPEADEPDLPEPIDDGTT